MLWQQSLMQTKPKKSPKQAKKAKPIVNKGPRPSKFFIDQSLSQEKTVQYVDS